MANADRVEVVGPTSVSDLAAAVAGVSDSPARSGEDGTASVTLKRGVVALISYDPLPGEQYPYLVTVYDSNMVEVSTSERLAASRQLYDALVEQTGWGLRYASDDAADFPIAQRPTVARAS